ncbi:MAG: NepR family anti-sigma factor [Pseudomonadota bacterium]
MPGDKESPKRPDQWRLNQPLSNALREQYKKVLDEPVPEKLKKLIEALKEQEKKEQED